MYKVSHQHGFRQFSMLPVEIKEQIYEHAMRMAGHFDTTLKAKPRCVPESLHLCYPRLPGVCRLNKIEHSIATQVLVRNTRIQLSHDTDAAVMTQWLTSIARTEEKGFAAVKKVELRHESMHRSKGFTDDIEFLKKCTTVQEVKITIPQEELSTGCKTKSPPVVYGAHPSSGEGVTRVLEPIDICGKFDLGRLITCKNLSHITFHIESQGDDSLYSLYETRCGKLEALAVMLKQDFMKIQNFKMEIEVQKLSVFDFKMQKWEARVKDIFQSKSSTL